VTNCQPISYDPPESERESKVSPALSMNFKYNNKKIEVEYSIQSLDIVLGIVGGLKEIFWSISILFIGGYSRFSASTDKLESFYTLDRKVGANARPNK